MTVKELKEELSKHDDLLEIFAEGDSGLYKIALSFESNDKPCLLIHPEQSRGES